MNINYRDMGVLIDFDGTITDKDTNIELFNQKGDLNMTLEELSKTEDSKNMSQLDKIRYVFDHIKIGEEEYKDFILSNFTMTEGFKEFYDRLRELDIPVAIVSGGFSNGIEIFLEDKGIRDIDIYAHRLAFDGNNISIEFHNDPLDCCEHGPCGNCKVLRYMEYKEIRDKIVFIGDGFTDRWVADKAEILFAKSDLVGFCKENSIDYIEWEDFNDINSILFK